MNLKNNIKILLFTTIGLKMLGFFHKIIFARFLDISILESMTLLSPLLSLALVLSSASLPSIINKEVSIALTNKNYSNRKIISSSLKITFSLSLLISFLFILSSFYLSTYIYQKPELFYPLIITIPLIIFSNFSGIIKAYLEAHENFKYPVLSNLIEQIFKTSILIITIVFFKNRSDQFILIILSLSLTIAEILSFSYLLLKIRKMTKLTLLKTTFTYDKKLLKPSFYLTLFALIFTLSAFLEPLIYYHFSAKTLISSELTRIIYTSLHSLILPMIQIASFLTYVLVKIFYPRFAKIKDNDLLEKNIKLAFYILLPINLVLFNLSVYLPKETLFFFFRKNNGYEILYFLAPITLYTFISPLVTALIQTKGYEKKLFKSGIISIVFSIISLMIFSLNQKTALYSLIYALIIKEIIYFSYNLFFIIKNFKIKLKILPLFSVCLILIISFFINNLLLEVNLYLRFIILSIVPISLSSILLINHLSSFKRN